MTAVRSINTALMQLLLVAAVAALAGLAVFALGVVATDGLLRGGFGAQLHISVAPAATQTQHAGQAAREGSHAVQSAPGQGDGVRPASGGASAGDGSDTARPPVGGIQRFADAGPGVAPGAPSHVMPSCAQKPCPPRPQ